MCRFGVFEDEGLDTILSDSTFFLPLFQYIADVFSKNMNKQYKQTNKQQSILHRA